MQVDNSTIRLPVRIQPFLRTMWFFWAAVVLVIIILNIPSQIDTISETMQGNLTAAAPSWMVAALNIATSLARSAASLISLTLAGVLFFRRPSDGMALFLSYFLLVIGIVPTPIYFLRPIWPGVDSFIAGVIQPLIFGPFLVAFLSIFPNGRLVPTWTRWLIIAAILYAPVGPFLFTAETYVEPTPIFVAGVLGWFVLIFTGLYAQIYRYRHISNSDEQQQIKWVVYAFTLSALFVFFSTIWTVISKSLPPDTPLLWWSPIIGLGWVLAYSTLPISLTIAVMRYRLYDIDFIINRTLVYGALSACVAGFYVLVVGSLGTFFQAQGNLIIALLATGIVAVLFQPLRVRLQEGVNRLIYGERDDPVEALSQLGKQLETAVPPDDVLPMLVETIAQTLKLPYVAIQFPAENEGRIAAEFGKPSQEAAHFPLIYQGESIGRLLVAYRSPGSSFSPAEMRLLRNIARQAGAAVHAIQLTIDLQRSRQGLVTAREEERRRLRRDLHDGLGATLAALNLEAAVLRRSIRSDPEKAETLVDEFRQDIRATIENIRHLVYELRPPTLDQLGLIEAVRAQARQCSQVEANGDVLLQVNVEAPETLPPLPAAVEVAAYRIAQEALTNVVHHAQAQHCVVWLEISDELKVEVVDDGVGVGNGRQPNSGLGLLSMRERAEELGGFCLIEPATGGGTRVVAWLPLLEV